VSCLARAGRGSPVWRRAGARAYMEDKHTIVSSFRPLGGAGAVDDGVQRSYFGVFDGAPRARRLDVGAVADSMCHYAAVRARLDVAAVHSPFAELSRLWMLLRE